ncbi:MAG TPA: GGDEF domain-containing protein [Casimicrobiaceae bacterium]|nr:GGDEF domain-containing protein [Casimicrobiaceae bacterium]
MSSAAPLLAPFDAADPDAALSRAALLADRGEAHAGRELAERVLRDARTADHPLWTVRALSVLSTAARALSDFPAAAKAAIEALDRIEAAQLTSHEAFARIDLALVFFDLGDYPKALTQLSEARRTMAVASDAAIESHCAHVEGLVQSRLGEFDLARASFERAIALSEQRRDDARRAVSLNSLGVVHLRVAQASTTTADASRAAFEDALHAFVEARRLAMREGDAKLHLLTEINVAGTLGGLGRYGEALELFLARLPSARAMGDRHHESLILANASEAARCAGKLDTALQLGEEALEVAQATASKVREREARLQLSLTCEAANDYAAALAHYKIHHALERESQAAEARRLAQAQALRAEVERAHRETAQLRQENRLLERQARQDSLTGLANRRAFDHALADEVARARADRRSVAVVAFDLDHFKSVNDRYTHAAGDAVLRETANVLRAHCRASDLAARIGGEEFVLLLPGADAESARIVAERVRGELAARTFSAVAAGVRVTLSAGVAVDDGVAAPTDLLRLADAALYRAKANGRDRVCVQKSSA